MCSMISVVNDNHVTNCLKEILTFVYYGSIVNNRPKNDQLINHLHIIEAILYYRTCIVFTLYIQTDSYPKYSDRPINLKFLQYP